MARVVITEFCDPDAVELLTAVHDVTYDRKLADRPGVLLTLVADADALVVRNRTRVDADLLAAAPICEIGHLGVGLDKIDVAVCESGGVAVRTAAGADAVAVAEHVIGALLSLARPALRATGRILGASGPAPTWSESSSPVGISAWWTWGRRRGRWPPAAWESLASSSPPLVDPSVCPESTE